MLFTVQTATWHKCMKHRHGSRRCNTDRCCVTVFCTYSCLFCSFEHWTTACLLLWVWIMDTAVMKASFLHLFHIVINLLWYDLNVSGKTHKGYTEDKYVHYYGVVTLGILWAGTDLCCCLSMTCKVYDISPNPKAVPDPQS